MGLADVIDAVRPAVVQIAFSAVGLTSEQQQQVGKPFYSQPLGTGFFVNDDAYVVTAQHVIEGARKLAARFPGAQISVGVGLAYPNSENMRANFTVVGFELIEEDARHDLALLNMGSNPFKGEVAAGIVIGDTAPEPLYGVPTLQPDRPRDGESITVSGYPLGETVLVTSTGIVASSWSVTIDEVPHPTVPDLTIPEMKDTYLADVQTNPGNSGGPVYDSETGAVVGVLVAGRLTSVLAGGQPAVINGVQLSADAGISLVVPTRYVVEMLERHGVAWTGA